MTQALPCVCIIAATVLVASRERIGMLSKAVGTQKSVAKPLKVGLGQTSVMVTPPFPLFLCIL